MMGFGSVGEGSGENSSSSMSNLSALAPPFTVDRLNLNPMLNPNPVLNYSELSYAVEPYSHTSQFPSPSAPRHDLDIHPHEPTSMPLNDYQFSDSIYLGRPSGVHWSDSTFVYGGGAKPYYSPSVPPMIGEGSTINEYDGQSSKAISPSGLSVSSQFGDNQSLFDLEYGPRWADNVRFSNGMGVKSVGLGGDFSSQNVSVGGSHSYNIQESQGIYDIPFGEKSQEVSGVHCGNLNRVSDSKVHCGQLAPGNLEDRPFIEQNADLLPYDCIKPCISESGSIFPDSYFLGRSCEMNQNVSNFQKFCGPYESSGLPFDPSFPCSVSVMSSSPAVVSSLPPSVSDFLGKDFASYRTTHTDNDTVVDFGLSGPSKRNDSSEIPSYCLNENFILPASGKESSGPLQSKDNFPQEFKKRVGSQSSDINVSSGFPMPCCSNQALYSPLYSSGFVDHHNPSVDSPCWKGVPSSLFSAFDIGPKNSFKKNLDQCYVFDHRDNKNLRSLCDSTRAFCKKGGEGNNNDDNSFGRNRLYSLEGTLNVNSLNTEQNLSDGAKAFVRTSSIMSSGGIQITNQANFQNEPNQPKNTESSFDVKFLDTKHLNVEEDAGLTLNDVSEGGSVAVCAAEKVLASPCSQEAGYKCAKPLPDTKFDVQTMIKATHHLSELLLCHLSCDACCPLEEENMEVIKSIISNLNACLRNNTDQETDEAKLKKCVQDTSAIIEESHSVDKISDGSSVTNETFNSHFQPNFKHMSEGKTEESLDFSPLRGGEGIKRNNDMTKAIKTILEENFHCEQEISSQALLFKSLWLEAEANLCSIGLKARLGQMKIEMGKIEANALKESEDVAEVMSQIRSMPDPNKDSKLTPTTHGGTSPSPALKNSFISSTMEYANDVEASIMARFKILKSRGDNIESLNLEKEQQLETGDSEHAGFIMERFNNLKSRENDRTSVDIGKGQQPEMADCDDLEPVLVRLNAMKPQEDSLPSSNKEQYPEIANDELAGSVMARLNILQSREARSRMYVKEEEKADMVDSEFPGNKKVAAVTNAQSEDEVFYLTPKRHQSGSLSEYEFGSKLDGCGYNSPKELHFSLADDPMMRSFYNEKMMNQSYGRLHDISLSSDWEHVQKDDFAWKTG